MIISAILSSVARSKFVVTKLLLPLCLLALLISCFRFNVFNNYLDDIGDERKTKNKRVEY